MARLYFMGVRDFPEDFRCRVYGDEVTAEDRQRAEFVERLASDGVLECPAYDGWMAALRERGWLPEDGDLEPNPDGPGRVKRWRLNDVGRREWAAMK